MFILSAIAGGVALTLLATMVTGKLRGMRFIPLALQREISRFLGYTLLAYLYLKLWDWAATSYYSHAPGTADALRRLNATTPFTTTFWWLEVIFGGIVPVMILLVPYFRRNERAVMVAAGLVILGVVINRWNTTLSGLVAPPNWSPGVLGGVPVAHYLPTFVEVAVGLGIVAYALGAFTLGARYLPIFSPAQDDAHP
jgi:molybdopterin-containing oxidoreductase family membrane subunit